LTSTIDGGEWSALRPGRFTPRGKSPWYSLDKSLGEFTADLDTVVKRKIPSPYSKSRLLINNEIRELYLLYRN
jgi:hypothetical protein